MNTSEDITVQFIQNEPPWEEGIEKSITEVWDNFKHPSMLVIEVSE